MNRTASEVTKILNMDVQHIKRWTIEFNEYLSAAANPAREHLVQSNSQET